VCALRLVPVLRMLVHLVWNYRKEFDSCTRRR